MITIKALRAAVVSERLEVVDKEIPKIAGNSKYVWWASTRALADSNVNIRDLGASIIEKGRFNENEFARLRLRLVEQLRRDNTNYGGISSSLRPCSA